MAKLTKEEIIEAIKEMFLTTVPSSTGKTRSNKFKMTTGFA